MSVNTIRDILSSSIPKTKQSFIPTSYDLIGTIAIVEIKPELKKYEKKIATAIQSVHKHILTVAKKASPMKGKYRVRKLKIILGKRSTETTYKEHGCIIALDVAKVYFSVRLSHERERISALVKTQEHVLVMFAGVGPFALVIAKKHPGTNVVGIELNPTAVRYFKENIVRNKLTNCTVLRGDVKKIISTKLKTQNRKLVNWADRICMPLPHGADKFLNHAFMGIKNEGTIHFYSLIENGITDRIIDTISRAAKKNKCTYSIINSRVVRPYAPHISQMVFDIKVDK